MPCTEIRKLNYDPSYENDLVSVIITTYKRPDNLKRAIESVLKQTYRNIEIIVVDDNNPDDEFSAETQRIMASYQENPKIKYIRHDKNRNGSAARNTGVLNSRGEFLCMLDDDDEYLPEKIERQVRLIKKLDDTWGGCYCYYKKIKNNKVYNRATEKKEGYIWFEELCRNIWHGGSSGPMIRRSVFIDVGGFNESFLRNQDIEYMLKISKKYKIAVCKYYGFLGYKDSFREKQATYEEVKNNFLNTFSDVVNSLSNSQLVVLKKHIALQGFRYYLLVEKNLKQAVQELKQGKVGLLTAIRYVFHLFARLILKKSYGFKIMIRK